LIVRKERRYFRTGIFFGELNMLSKSNEMVYIIKETFIKCFLS